MSMKIKNFRIILMPTRNSVNRILRGLRENGIIFIADQKILIKDKEYLEQYVKG